MPAAPEAVRNRAIEIAAQPKSLFALVGANLHPIAGPEIKGGTLVIAGGKIAAIGPAGTAIPPEAQTIEMSGLDIWPGMVDAGSSIGLFEIGSLAETQDHSDAAQYQPELHSSVALHPDSEHIPVTRANGILTSFIEPSGGVISGPGLLDRPERLGSPRDGDRRRGRPERSHSDLCVALAGCASAWSWSEPGTPGAGWPRRRGRRRCGCRGTQGPAREDQRAFPAGRRL